MVKYDFKKTQSWKLVNEDKESLALLVSARRLDLFLREVVNVCSLLILLNKPAPRSSGNNEMLWKNYCTKQMLLPPLTQDRLRYTVLTIVSMFLHT